MLATKSVVVAPFQRGVSRNLGLFFRVLLRLESGTAAEASSNVVHVPTLLQETCSALSSALASDSGERTPIFVDCTFGSGGHTRKILESTQAKVYCLDRDGVAFKAAVKLSEEPAHKDRLYPIQTRFSQMVKMLGKQGVRPGTVDAILMDLGPSLMQFKDPKRGFSFRHAGPLDMRMGNTPEQSQKTGTAADLVNGGTEKQLSAILREFGGERHADRIAQSIVQERKKGDICTTDHLERVIRNALPLKLQVQKDKLGRLSSPATRTFMALRIVVNDELGELQRGLVAAAQMLRPGGRLGVITFHSLECAMVKNCFQSRPLTHKRTFSEEAMAESDNSGSEDVPKRMGWFTRLTKKPIRPLKQELVKNAKARSASLRVGIRTDGAVSEEDVAFALCQDEVS